MFGCILCERNNEWVYQGYLCEDCIKVQNIMRIYGIEKVNDILSKVLVVEKFVDKPVLETTIEAPITRSKK
tara:strand:- start:170 stop:382 length:213 start_codon:yes stop_codon:yes gene_type:complete